MELFARNIADNEKVHIPAGHGEYSSRRVLTMEMLDGFSIADTKKLQAANYDTKALARTGANMYLDMVFRDRFFHADPHPGNIWVLPGGRIGLLDSGMIGRLDEALHDELAAMVLAVADNDPTELTDCVIRICTLPGGFDRNALRTDIDDFLSGYLNQSLENMDGIRDFKWGGLSWWMHGVEQRNSTPRQRYLGDWRPDYFPWMFSRLPSAPGRVTIRQSGKRR